MLQETKVRLVAQGYNKIEGVDFDETITPVTSPEAVNLLLGVSCLMKFKLYHEFFSLLNGHLNEEVCVEPLKGLLINVF